MGKHEPNEAAGITPEIAAELDKAAAEMATENTTFDPSALSTLHQADVGRSTQYGSTYARVDGVTGSKQISYHDNLWNTLFNAFPELESEQVEELMGYVLGTSVYKAHAEGYEGFSQERLEEILALDQVAVEDLLDGEDDEDDEDELEGYDEEETGADEA